MGAREEQLVAPAKRFILSYGFIIGLPQLK